MVNSFQKLLQHLIDLNTSFSFFSKLDFYLFILVSFPLIVFYFKLVSKIEFQILVFRSLDYFESYSLFGSWILILFS